MNKVNELFGLKLDLYLYRFCLKKKKKEINDKI